MIKLVKGVKKSLLQAVGDSVLSLNELNTLLDEVANLLNERPIGVKPITQELIQNIFHRTHFTWGDALLE